MTVSVIVPIYNSIEYLSECVQSITSQTHSDLDIILVNDGSTDASGEWCSKYAAADPRIRVINKPNGGLSSARNAGLDIAKGEYVTFVDADDVIHPSSVETLLALIGSRDVAISQFFRSKVCRWPQAQDINIREYTPAEAIEDTLYQRGITNSACAKLFASRLFDGLRFSDGLWYEDLDLFYKVYERASNGLISTSQELYFYRINPKSFINTFDRRRLDVLKVTQRIVRHYSDEPLLLRAAKDREFSANFNMFILTSHYNLKPEADECWRMIRQHRRAELTNPKVRVKNRLGALLSYLGRRSVLSAAKIMFKNQ